MKEIVKSKDYTDNFADVFLTTGIKVGENTYCRITFCRHVLDPKAIPEPGNDDTGIDLYVEALQSVTLPMSMARNMANAILAAPVNEPNMVTPHSKEI
ncbi:TPA: hypothetical protein KEY88_005297 [Serratia marcescens]|uniref:Uncharacterized protein n=1 Tax=Serratia ureilytica TaxID=300181 RepID=A0A9X9G0P5_9GAMM|nr:hypothetical protein [Serratia ureilytica]TXE24484.1 hypothetical protein FOT63_23725 [Serratia ureilytica]HBC7422524.1 hypothetical protein [Serratia marcescens]